jgi:hypothetical protein
MHIKIAKCSVFWHGPAGPAAIDSIEAGRTPQLFDYMHQGPTARSIRWRILRRKAGSIPQNVDPMLERRQL